MGLKSHTSASRKRQTLAGFWGEGMGRRELGAAPVVVYVAGCYGVLSVEALLAALGRPVRESLLPFGGHPEPPEVPP